MARTARGTEGVGARLDSVHDGKVSDPCASRAVGTCALVSSGRGIEWREWCESEEIEVKMMKIASKAGGEREW